MNGCKAVVVILAMMASSASIVSARAQQREGSGAKAARPPSTNESLMSDCPMHAEHVKAQQAPEHAQGVDKRGDQAMGFSHVKTTHHFILSADGGVIQVTADSAADADSLKSIRQHLKHIAGAFTAGDFNIPGFVHGRTPPGVPEMKAAGDAITYTYREIDGGAQVVIATKQPKVLAAIHDFLRFQIEDHRTGDAVVVK